MVPFYEYTNDDIYGCDGAPSDIAAARRAAFERLRDRLAAAAPDTLAFTYNLEPSVSDMQFTAANRVPFQFRNFVRRNLRIGGVADATEGVRMKRYRENRPADVCFARGTFNSHPYVMDFSRSVTKWPFRYGSALDSSPNSSAIEFG